MYSLSLVTSAYSPSQQVLPPHYKTLQHFFSPRWYNPKCQSRLLHIVKPFSIQLLVLFQRFSYVSQLWKSVLGFQSIQSNSGTQPLLIPWVLGILPPWRKQLWWKSDHLHPPSIKAKKVWRYTSTSPYAFMALCITYSPLATTCTTCFNIKTSHFVYRVYLCPSNDSKYITVIYTAGNLNPLTMSCQKSLDMDILQMGNDMMITQYACCKPFMVKFLTSMNGRRGPNQINGAWSTPIKALGLEGIDGASEGDIASAFGSTPQYSRLKYMHM